MVLFKKPAVSTDQKLSSGCDGLLLSERISQKLFFSRAGLSFSSSGAFSAVLAFSTPDIRGSMHFSDMPGTAVHSAMPSPAKAVNARTKQMNNTIRILFRFITILHCTIQVGPTHGTLGAIEKQAQFLLGLGTAV